MFSIVFPNLNAAGSLPSQSPQVFIAVMATGSIEANVSRPLESQIRSDLPELAAELTIVLREGGSAQAKLVRVIDELASLHPAVLVCLDLFSAQVAKTRLQERQLSIPIVFLAHADPVAGHLIDGYARPGNNLTGVSTYRCVDSKMLEILSATFPTRKRIGYLLDGSDDSADNKSCLDGAKLTAERLHRELVRVDLTAMDFLTALGKHLKTLHLDAILAPASAPLWQNRKPIVQILNDARLPAIYESDIFLAEGGLMSYGPVRTDAIPELARSVSKVLHGESAGEIPVDRPTLLEFVINLHAPHFSDFDIKAAALRRADRVLE